MVAALRTTTATIVLSANPIPFALKGKLVYLPDDARALTDFSKLPSQGTLYATKLDVPERDFETGFPGVSDRFEWFALDYHGAFNATAAGSYGFALESDDGSKLFIDGKLVIDNDGVHASTKKEGSTQLAPGPHSIEVQYFQGPRTEIALVLEWKLPGQKDYVKFEAAKAAPAQIAERQRARSVAGWLTQNGVAAARVVTRGYGKRAPRVPNDSPENRHKNRRVELAGEGCPGK